MIKKYESKFEFQTEYQAQLTLKNRKTCKVSLLFTEMSTNSIKY